MSRRRVVPLFVSGFQCPVSCVYCDQSEQTGVAAPLGVADVHAALDRAGASPDRSVEIAFYGGTFTALSRERQERLLSAVAPARAEGAVCGLRVSTHPRWLGSRQLELLKEHHVDLVEVGVQSLDDAVLRAAGRGVTADETLAALGRVRASGLALGVQTMVGLPEASRASDDATAAALCGLGAELARVYPTVVIRGTKLAAWFRAGRYRPMTAKEAVVRAADQVARFEGDGVRVQRIGLHQDSDLESAVVSGPQHPAFGECVRAELAYRELRRLAAGRRGRLRVRVPERELSRWLGHARGNVARFAAEFDGRALEVRPDPALAAGVVEVVA